MDKASLTSDVLLFGAQGASSDAAAARLLDEIRKSGDAETKQLVDDFLQGCFEAFHSELDKLADREKCVLEHSVWAKMDKAETLVTCPPGCQSNAVVECVTFYVHQMLDLLAYMCQASRDGEVAMAQAAGICSGIIPAVLVASFPSWPSTHFVDYAIDAFRVAFWIGVRSSLARWKRMQGNAWDMNNAWALSIRGCVPDQLQDLVDDYNKANLADGLVPIRISAIFTDDLASLTGAPASLERFRTQLPPFASARFPQVHGYYHGGPDMEHCVQEVLADVESGNISFPTWSDLQIPLHSTRAAGLLKPDGSHSLLDVALRHILVDVIHWKQTWDYLEATTLSTSSTRTPIRLVFVGPNTTALRLSWNSLQVKPDVEVTTSASVFQSPPSQVDDIAIVGMSVNLPCGEGITQFWDTLKNGTSAVSEIPPTRFDVSRYNVPVEGVGTTGKSRPSMQVKHGNFLKNPFAFDNVFFGISPREAKSMDPQQRLLLHASFEALEDAGYAPDSTLSNMRDTFGVYIGVATGDYVDNLRGSPDVYYSTGTLRAFLSGRISYAYGFKGPSIVVDTACSSSLAAIYQACRALQTGDCQAALAGGVNVISSPDMYLGLARAHFLNQTGQCKPFDQDADGYCRGEGCGMVVLKRKSQAIHDGDRILGIIRGIGVNQCGESKSITHPDHATQSALFRSTLQRSHLSPSAISVVEAHGTGTQAGDTAETRSLQTVFAHSRPSTNPLYLSSVKGNIGHAEAASGLAGLAKLILMMRHKQLPPQASFRKLNPSLGLVPGGNIVVPTHLTPWNVAVGSKRLALLNNFGAAGSNVALILEEPPLRQSLQAQSTRRSCHVLTLSAKTATALEHLRSQFISFIEFTAGLDITSLCYTANARRMEHDAFRLAVTANTLDELAINLRQPQASTRSLGGPEKSMAGGFNTVFVFSGQGGIHAGMGAELLTTSPHFSKTVLACDSILSASGFPKSAPYFAGDGLSYYQSLDSRSQIIVAQCACFVLEFALAQTWIAWGVVPDLVIGHSIGEYAAFAVAGVLSLRDAVLMVAGRADLMARFCKSSSSGMMTCRMSSSQAQGLIATNGLHGLSVACENSPEDTVVAGGIDDLETFAHVCKSAKVRTTRLDVPFAYHSAAMDPIMGAFQQQVSTIRMKPPTISVGSSLRGRVLASGLSIEDSYFVEHAREPTRFSDLVHDVAQKSVHYTNMVFVEVGPSAATITKLKWAFAPEQASLLPSLSPKHAPWTILAGTLRLLYLQGRRLNWRQIYASAGAEFLESLPRYPLDTKPEFLVPFKEQDEATELPEKAAGEVAPQSEPRRTPYKFLSHKMQADSNDARKFEFVADILAIVPFIKAHQVGEMPLCPASVYIELALEAVELSLAEQSRGLSPKPTPADFYLFTDISFDAPLVYNETRPIQHVSMALHSEPGATRGHYGFESGAFCAGRIATQLQAQVQESVVRKTAFVHRQTQSTFGQDAKGFERFSARTIYKIMFPRVVAYSSLLETLSHLIVSGSGLEGHGIFRLPPPPTQYGEFDVYDKRFVCHPALIDTMLHAAGLMANAKVEATIACICSQVDRFMLPADSSQLHAQELSIYCSIVDVGHSMVGDSYVLDAHGRLVAWVEGMSFKKLSLKSFKRHLSVISGSVHGNQDLPQAQPSLSDTAEVTPLGAQSPVTPVQADPAVMAIPPLGNELRDMFLDIFGVNIGEADKQSSLSALGVDSMGSIELLQELEARFAIRSLGDPDWIPALTLQELESTLQKQISSAADPRPFEPARDSGAAVGSRPKTPELLEGSRSEDIESAWASFPLVIGTHTQGAIPLYLFHDGSGRCSMYSKLAVPGYNLFGVFSPRTAPFGPVVHTMEDLAALYIEKAGLRNQQRVMLGGWSFGGVLAFEVAKQLQSHGISVLGVILIDSPPPLNHEPLPQAVIDYVVNRLPVRLSLTRDDLSAQFSKHANLLKHYHPAQAPGVELPGPPCVLIRCTRTFDTERLCGVSYPWLCSTEFREDAAKGWEQVVGAELQVNDLDCNHFDVFDSLSTVSHEGYQRLNLPVLILAC
ncbi:Conidial yellow pigment biosynthesis polyketide synthase [Cytospora mali]|uniref:Conidial yellow pigment biosynthesis polyketide synthase n=1 Tax=Cytospora mali TaxID=578113 RepID=A0A194VYC5_CYTMA|nr:Conidial yellow pigment biosynthesis polyketide synthase [Valsa mali]